jgi:ABC-type multidrug transport system fused ATPase/permease subunit
MKIELINLLKKILNTLNRSQKKELLTNSLLSVLVSINEALTVGLFVGFITLATKIKEFESYTTYQIFNKFFVGISEVDFLVVSGVLLIIYFILRAVFNYFYIYRLALFSEKIYEHLAYSLIEVYLNISYEDFNKRGMGSIQKVLISETYNFTHVISSLLILISELFLLVILSYFMLINDWKTTIFLIVFLMFSTIVVKMWTSNKMIELGSRREESHKKYYQNINNIYRNFKYLKVSPYDQSFIRNVRENIKAYINTNIGYSSLSQLPRSMLELTGYSAVISIFIYLIIINDGNILEIIPSLSLIAIGLSRMLPSVNRLVAAFNQINFHKATIDLINEEMSLKQDHINLVLSKFSHIEIKNLSVNINGKKIIKNINMSIKKGSRIGILGQSGSGKTTLIDVLIGIRDYSEGSILIDGKISSKKRFLGLSGIVSYIPQNIFLSDMSILDNITMGTESDNEKVLDILGKVELRNIFMAREGLNTKLGDGGVEMSGGQSQRIGIARALYRNSEVIIMDEPTSSLDEVTSQRLMKNVYEISKNKTLIVVTHNPKILFLCDKIYNFANGELNEVS